LERVLNGPYPRVKPNACGTLYPKLSAWKGRSGFVWAPVTRRYDMAYIKMKSRITRLEPEGSHRLSVWVDEYEGVTPDIFVYQRYPAVPEDPGPLDQFVNVASPADIAEYPVASPVGDLPFFRRSDIDLVFRSVKTMDEAVAGIKRDILALLANLEKLEKLGEDDVWLFNAALDESSSSSSSESSSS
jgi:hypothetical protein